MDCTKQNFKNLQVKHKYKVHSQDINIFKLNILIIWNCNNLITVLINFMIYIKITTSIIIDKYLIII